MTPDECMAAVIQHRISVDAATRVVVTERGDVDVPIWIARRLGESVSHESYSRAVEALAVRQGLWRPARVEVPA